IIFSDMAVATNTDTIQMRALFPYPDHEQLPGAYVRVVFDRAVRDNDYAIPRDAVIRTAQGASVFLVGPEGVL
ncbi:efflux transporter periplasmic adaptor subunit, partial [Akkermansia muciniphila]|nr:efflux transporter periplasmic adaptor subunit [Akkermansia muciniphila]